MVEPLVDDAGALPPRTAASAAPIAMTADASDAGKAQQVRGPGPNIPATGWGRNPFLTMDEINKMNQPEQPVAAVEKRIRDARHEIHRTGAGSRHHHARLAQRTRVALRRKHPALLVARQDRADAILDLAPRLGAPVVLDAPLDCVEAEDLIGGGTCLLPAARVFLPGPEPAASAHSGVVGKPALGSAKAGRFARALKTVQSHAMINREGMLRGETSTIPIR